MPEKEKSTFGHFFKEDSKTIQDILIGKSDQKNANVVKPVDKVKFPIIIKPGVVDENETKFQWRKLRSFFRNGNNTQKLPEDFSPVTMAPLYTKNMVGTDFPVWIAGDDYIGESKACISLKEILHQALGELETGDHQAPILKENIERILHIATNHLGNSRPQLFQTAIPQILNELKVQIEVSGEEARAFHEDLENFRQLLPVNGILLPYSVNTSFQLLEAAMFASRQPGVNKLKSKIQELQSKLKDQLRIEREKGPERKNPESLKDALSFVDSMLKFNELSSMLPEAGTEGLGDVRIQRMKEIIDILESAQVVLDQKGFLFVDKTLVENTRIDWDNLFEDAELKVFHKGSGLDSISSTFIEQITAFTKIFIAKRIGELELANSYQPDIHDDYFKNFNWQSFTTDELNNCPHFLLIADDLELLSNGYSKLSTMLANNFPIKVIAVKRHNYVQGLETNSENTPPELHSRIELSALMLSHKNIYVSQCTSITPQSMFTGFCEGLSAFAPAFFNVLNIDEHIHQNPYLWISATIEGRDFPGFTFKGLLGTPWGSRFDVSNNPQPERPWPVHNLEVIDADGTHQEMEFTFTFADLAVLNPIYHRYFLLVNPSFWSDDLIPLTEYMDLREEDMIGKLPFISMMNSDHELQKVAVSWAVVVATQERQDFWRFLQENSGINNYHVAQAVNQAQADLEGKHWKEITKLSEAHQAEIQKVKAEEAENVMENLTSVLLNLDMTNLVSAEMPAIRAPSKKEDKIEEVTVDAPAEPKEEESVLSNDPYIDTALCTSCNECTNMNGKMFHYNADKMAYIADPSAGTFKELVEAAELCPVGIIHPGTPLNPNEENLDNLIKRAEKFN